MFKLVMIEGYFEGCKFMETKKKVINTGSHHIMQTQLEIEAGYKHKNEGWDLYTIMWGDERLLKKGKNFCLLTVEESIPEPKHKPVLDEVIEEAMRMQEAEIQRFAQKCIAAYWGIAP